MPSVIYASQEGSRSLMRPLLADPLAVRNALEGVPTGAAVWYVEPFFCVFNRSAKELTGFSDRDFQWNQSLWLSRVHRHDLGLVSAARRKLQTGKQKVICDYRFLPNGHREEIWIRDISLPWRNHHGKIGGIVSVYTDISTLMAGSTQSTADLKKIIKELSHDVRNYVHVIAGALETLRLTGSLPLQTQQIITPIEELNKLVGDLEEFLFPPNPQISDASPVLLLQDVVLKMEDELLHRGIHLELVHESSLPDVRLDARQVRRAIQRVLDFSVALLPKGGILNIKARQREIDSLRYVELEIISHSAYPLQIDPEDVFQPFLQVGKYKAGLSLTLARETIYRNRGQISFLKKNYQETLFRVLLEVCAG